MTSDPNNMPIRADAVKLQLSKGDYLVFALALLLITGSAYLWHPGRRAMQADITVGGKFLRHVDLFQDQILHIHGKLGQSTLVVKDGSIRFTASPCTSKLCIHTGWIASAGEIATCLPNEVSVQISGPDPRYDAINF